MRVKLVSVLAAALGISGVHVASAADLAVKAKPQPLPVVFTWTGFYAGVNAGYGWGTTTATDELATNGACWNQCGFQWATRPAGFVGGGQLGYNWQFGNFVVGLEGDLGYLALTGNAAASISTDTIVNTRGGIFATARGRLGYTFDRVLVYGTGGWFGADLNSSVNDNIGSAVNTASTGFQSGWTAGAGVEWAFAPSWSVKGEWLYYDLGDNDVGGACCGGHVTQFFNIKNTGDIVRAGLNYHF